MKELNVFCKDCGVVSIPTEKLSIDLVYTYFYCPKCRQKISVDLGLNAAQSKGGYDYERNKPL